VVSIERDKGKRANKAEVRLHDLSDTSLAWVEQSADLSMQILAGDHYPQQVFLGDIDPRGVITELTAAGRITTIKAGDGRRNYRSALFVRSYPSATLSDLILADILTEVGLPLGYRDPLLISVLYPAGTAWATKAQVALDDVVTAMGGTWSIQDGAIEIISLGSTVPDTAVVISAATGMRGSPKRTDRGIEVVTHLAPSVRPGRIVYLESARLSGFYRVSRVRHAFDSRGLQWQSTIDGELFEGV
jgi:hypothetical protein